MSRRLALMGSGEFTEAAVVMDKWLLNGTARDSGRVLIVPTASAPEGDEVFEGWIAMGEEHYRKLGADPVPVRIKNREDAHRSELVELLDDAQAVYFSGGNPGFLVKSFRDTPFWERLVALLDQGLSVGGCSAGAVFLGALAPDVTSSDVDDGEGVPNVEWVPGLAVLPEMFIGAHWDMLDHYIPGLTGLVKASQPPGTVLVGIDEDTGICGNGTTWEVRGSKSVMVLRAGEETIYKSGATFSL